MACGSTCHASRKDDYGSATAWIKFVSSFNCNPHQLNGFLFSALLYACTTYSSLVLVLASLNVFLAVTPCLFSIVWILDHFSYGATRRYKLIDVSWCPLSRKRRLLRPSTSRMKMRSDLKIISVRLLFEFRISATFRLLEMIQDERNTIFLEHIELSGNNVQCDSTELPNWPHFSNVLHRSQSLYSSILEPKASRLSPGPSSMNLTYIVPLQAH